MIPTLGVMIGCYICFRCVEVWCKAASEYNEAGRYVARSAALLLLLATAVLMVDLMLSGVRT